ncbi:MAG: fumarate reductase subunit FrdD [Burkholderiales bacterium]|nr:fumarate reductase subunit FrdD [Burkholderiales bacterium]
MSTRSKQPIFWLLFGAGGMLSALIGWMLVFITGIAIPLGIFLQPDLFSYEKVLAFHRHWAGKAFTFLVISLFLWHGAHRIFHSLHDLGVKAHAASAWACYGIAMTGTLAAAVLLLTI